MYHLGTVDYADAFRLQKRLQHSRIEGLIGDTVLLLEHPPVITLGRRGNRGNVLVTEAWLGERGIEIVHADRGGDVTFHNPGQIVAYFIINIVALRESLYRYVHSLEEIVIQALADFQIQGARDEKHPGVWVGREKICAIGLHLSRGVSAHGFALNVNNDLSLASCISPCGLRDRGVTSISGLLSQAIDIQSVVKVLLQKMENILNIKIDFHATGSEKATPMKVMMSCPQIP